MWTCNYLTSQIIFKNKSSNLNKIYSITLTWLWKNIHHNYQNSRFKFQVLSSLDFYTGVRLPQDPHGSLGYPFQVTPLLTFLQVLHKRSKMHICGQPSRGSHNSVHTPPRAGPPGHLRQALKAASASYEWEILGSTCSDLVSGVEQGCCRLCMETSPWPN